MSFTNNRNEKFEDLIEKSEIKTFKQYALDGKKGKTMILRHDVDLSIDNALKLARYEYSHDIRSTYFLLHTAKYFNYSEELATKCKKIVDYGHDIGLHNNVLTICFKRKVSRKIREINKIIRPPLNFLRKNGIEVIGTSAHGVKRCYIQKYFNYELWKEFDPQRNEGLLERKIRKMSLKTYGLLYEAYFIDYDFYLSDSGNTWSGLIVDEFPIVYEKNLKYGPKNVGLEALEKYRESSSGVIQILIHPIYWREV